MVILYVVLLVLIRPLIGNYPNIPIRGAFNFLALITFTCVLFLVLTFFVIDAILLHCGFLKQLKIAETYWPRDTFKGFKYPTKPDPEGYETELAYFWDILLISRRTEAVGNLIYYPFIILFCLIVARLPFFDNWTWTPMLVVTLSMHFSLALFAAWRLPKAAVEYRDDALGQLNLSRRKALMDKGSVPEAIDTMIDEVRTIHKGAFSYPWDQPAIRALLLPSGGIGIATLLQYLAH
jgi:hypothetical protein